MTVDNEKYNKQVDKIFDAALNHWQIRGMTMVDTPFVAGLIEGLREQVKEIPYVAHTENGPKLARLDPPIT